MKITIPAQFQFSGPSRPVLCLWQ